MSLEEVLYNNKIKEQERMKKELIRIKKEHKKECVLTAFIMIAIFAGTTALIISSENERGQAINSCIQKHSENYCYKNM